MYHTWVGNVWVLPTPSLQQGQQHDHPWLSHQRTPRARLARGVLGATSGPRFCPEQLSSSCHQEQAGGKVEQANKDQQLAPKTLSEWSYGPGSKALTWYG